MAQKIKRKLGELLIEDNLLTQDQLKETLSYQKENGGLLGEILVKKGFVTEDVLLSMLGRQFKIPYLSLKNYSVNSDAGALVSSGFCHEHNVVAFDCDSRRIFIAVSDPMNDEAIEKIAEQTKLLPQVFLSRPSEILNSIFFIYHETNCEKDKNG